MKREYLDYLLLALPKMTDDALIVIDDVEKFRGKMDNLYIFLDENQIKYIIEKTDADDSIMIISRTNL
jgi:predicted O-methyltransferase YrrM